MHKPIILILDFVAGVEARCNDLASTSFKSFVPPEKFINRLLRELAVGVVVGASFELYGIVRCGLDSDRHGEDFERAKVFESL